MPPPLQSRALAKPNDFHLYGPVIKIFAGDADVKQAVTPWLQTTDTGFFYAGIQALMPWRHKCLNVNGEYLEMEHLLPMCYVCSDVRIKFSASECLLPYLLKLLCRMVPFADNFDVTLRPQLNTLHVHCVTVHLFFVVQCINANKHLRNARVTPASKK